MFSLSGNHARQNSLNLLEISHELKSQFINSKNAKLLNANFYIRDPQNLRTPVKSQPHPQPSVCMDVINVLSLSISMCQNKGFNYNIFINKLICLKWFAAQASEPAATQCAPTSVSRSLSNLLISISSDTKHIQ